MNQYRIEGNNGWARNMWCHPMEAVAQWKRIGGNARLYLVHADASRTLIRGEETDAKPAPAANADHDISFITHIPQEHIKPLKCRFATPSW